MDQNPQNPKKQFRNYIVFSGIAVQMGVTIAVFTVIGIWLDRKFPNHNSYYTVIFSLLGVFGAMYSTIKQVINFSKEQNND
jgi:F0F1-type ATP synthase assembly protein I